MNPSRPQQSAFSLVEVSIVLVILGLLTGGILAGQSLIRAAELRSVSNDISKYKAATYTFRDKYFALPGDMPIATSFWGDQATGTGSCASASTTDGTPGTCNGNGDGTLLYSVNGEPARLWQHLAFAGLVEGSFTGIGIMDQPGVNVPASKFNGGAFSIVQSTENGFVTGVVAIDSNKIVFGRTTLGATGTLGAVLRPEEAWNVDTKLDDGNGYMGMLRAWTGTGNSGGCGTGAAYDLANNGIACFINLTL